MGERCPISQISKELQSPTNVYLLYRTGLAKIKKAEVKIFIMKRLRQTFGFEAFINKIFQQDSIMHTYGLFSKVIKKITTCGE